MNIAIITGASSGMGKDFVSVIDRDYELDEIWVVARRKERLEALKGTTRAVIVPISMDLSSEESISALSDRLDKSRPSVKLLVNAAGFGIFRSFENTSYEDINGMVDLNVKALVSITHRVLPYMESGSAIINLGSNSSWQPVPYMPIYGATKSFVLSFSRALSVELKKKGIRVLAVCPGWIRTEFFERAVLDDTIKYYDRFYESIDVVEKAMKDLKKGKMVSILGFPVRMQVRLVKILPAKLIMSIWCRQQGK